MPSKKGKKDGLVAGSKNKANEPKPEASHPRPSTTAQSDHISGSQHIIKSTKVGPKPVAEDPLQVQAALFPEQDAQLTRTWSQSTLDELSLELEELAAAAAMGSSGSKRKERAAATLPDPTMNVGDLVNRLLSLKIRAGLMEVPSMSSAVSAIELDRTAADEDLKDRARRMAKIQQRTLAEHPDAVLVKEPVESFVERLLAVQEASKLSRGYADEVYKHDDPLAGTKYLWGIPPMWSAKIARQKLSEEPGLEEHRSRWQKLTSALRESKEYERLKDAVDKDFEYAGRLLQKDNVRSAIDQIFQHAEYAKFREGDSGGLIVHAYDADSSENLSRGLRMVWRGRLKESVVSGFPYRFLTEFKGPGIAMMHVARVDNTFRPQKHALAGWRGLFRNLCNQMIAQNPYMTGVRLTGLPNAILEELRNPFVPMETMFKLFHYLVWQVADMGVRRGWPVQEVIVVVDGIDWLEDQHKTSAWPTFDALALVREYKKMVQEYSGQAKELAAHWRTMTPTEQKVVQSWLIAEAKGEKPETQMPQAQNGGLRRKSDMSWELVVDFFRSLADECNCSNLGTKVRFKYILLHPLSSRLGANPSVMERYITLDKDL